MSETVSKVCTSQSECREIVTRLIAASQWFMVMPMPDDQWKVTVKGDAERFLSKPEVPAMDGDHINGQYIMDHYNKGTLRVKVLRLGDTEGMLIGKKYLDVRKVGAVGVVEGWVPGHGGDVWWVRHEDGTVGAYIYTELTIEGA